jgi:UDP-N-acetylmuramate--alanine ligase
VPESLELAHARKVHIVGIGGAGMSAIAIVLARMGLDVSGSDLKESRALDRLRAAGIDAVVGHRAEHVTDSVDAVVISTAIPANNPEVVAARERGIPVHRRAEALRAIVATRRGIAVAGSHGKTTTSSMLALVLRAAGWRPTFIIGGDVNEVGTNAAYDDGEWMVVEADESDGTFLELPAEAAIVTNIEPDHLDHYGSFDELVRAFDDFVARVPGPRVVCADDPLAAALAARAGLTTFGFAETADYRIVEWSGGRDGSRLVIARRGEALGSFTLPVPGRHNALNAVAAAALATELSVPFADTARALAGFGGVARRFEFRGERDGVTLVDDYAHLPTEVRSMIGAARDGGWNRVVAVFQPHRYSRTARLWQDFADSFVDADVVVLTDVYPAGETPQPGVSGRLVLRAILDAHPDTSAVYLPRHHDVVAHALRFARPGDIVLTLGAGDLTTVPDEWLQGDAVDGMRAS